MSPITAAATYIAQMDGLALLLSVALSVFTAPPPVRARSCQVPDT